MRTKAVVYAADNCFFVWHVSCNNATVIGTFLCGSSMLSSLKAVIIAGASLASQTVRGKYSLVTLVGLP